LHLVTALTSEEPLVLGQVKVEYLSHKIGSSTLRITVFSCEE